MQVRRTHSAQARAGLRAAEKAREAAKEAREAVDVIEGLLADAKAAAAEAQHQADLAAAESNGLNPDRLLLRSPQPENTELALIGSANVEDIEDLDLAQLVEAIDFPAFSAPYEQRKSLKQPYVDGELEVTSGGFTYYEWNAASADFRIWISYTHSGTPSASIHEYSAKHRRTVKEYVGTKWEPVLHRLIVEAWLRRHGVVARTLAEHERANERSRDRLVRG